MGAGSLRSVTYYRPLSEVTRDYVRWATSEHPRVGTGFDFFDSRTQGGCAAGEVLMFQARSGVGKTAVAGNIVAGNRHLPTVFFSLEMHARYIAMRLAAITTGTATKRIEYDLRTTGRSLALQELVELYPRLAIIDKPGMSLKEMGVACQEAAQVWQEHPQLIVIDFLELIGGVPSLSAVEAVDKVARKVKDFAREQDAVVLLLHQVGRGEGGAGEEPLSMASGRYGGEISADYVLGAYRPCMRKGISADDYENERWQIFLQFLKTRGGSELHPSGFLHQFNPDTMQIGDWTYRTAPLWDEVPA